MLCIEFNRPEVASYADKRESAIKMLEMVVACLKSCPENPADAGAADKDVVGLCAEIGEQIHHDIDILKFLDW